jgi:hypothetical protein
MSASVPPPPPQLLVQTGGCTVMVTLEELLPDVLVELGDSPTIPVLVICMPAVSDEFTSAAMVKVAVELGVISPMVHVPVEVA